MEAASRDVALVDTKRQSQISPLDLKEIDIASSLAETKEKLLTDLSVDVGEMNFIQLFWDSKVPENKKSFFNRFSLRSSDPNVIQGEIEKYLTFYGKMKTVMRVVRRGSMGSDEDVEGKILELYECLREMAEKARSGEKFTDSKILCQLHKKFVSEHEKVEYRIRRVESGALRQKQSMLTQRWEQALKTIDSLTDSLEKAEKEKGEMKVYLTESLTAQNQKWESYREEMLQENRKAMDLLEKKEEENKQILRQQEQLLEENRQQRSENKEIMALLQKLVIDKN